MKSKKSTEKTNKTGGEKFYSIPLFSINQKLNSIISGILVGFCMVIGITCSGPNGNNSNIEITCSGNNSNNGDPVPMSMMIEDPVFTVSSSIPADPRNCYSGDITVTMSTTTSGAEIFYTLDDADVLCNGQATNSDYHDVQLTASNNSITSKTLRAYATDGLNNSLVKEQVFLLKPGNDTGIAGLLGATLANPLFKDAITGTTIGGDGNLKITTKKNISLPSSLSGCIQILWESELPYILDHSGEVQLPLPSRRDVDIALTGTLDIYQTDNATLASDTAQLDVTLEHGDQVHPSGTVEERTKFMREGKWGLFIHYVPGARYRRTYWNITQDHEKPLNEGWDAVISGIDTDTLARQLFEVGAGWLVFTIKHDEVSLSAFNDFPYYDKNMKRIALNQTTARTDRQATGVPVFDDYTTTRDLLRDILDSLAPYGIKFIFYYPAYPRNIWSYEGFVPWWGNVLETISRRYGDDVAGWWLDGGFYDCWGLSNIRRYYYDLPCTGNIHGVTPKQVRAMSAFEIEQAIRVANPEAVIALNIGTGADAINKLTVYNDFTSGEANAIHKSEIDSVRYPGSCTGAVGSKTGSQWYAEKNNAFTDIYSIHKSTNDAGVPLDENSSSTTNRKDRTKAQWQRAYQMSGHPLALETKDSSDDFRVQVGWGGAFGNQKSTLSRFEENGFIPSSTDKEVITRVQDTNNCKGALSLDYGVDAKANLENHIYRQLLALGNATGTANRKIFNDDHSSITYSAAGWNDEEDAVSGTTTSVGSADAYSPTSLEHNYMSDEHNTATDGANFTFTFTGKGVRVFGTKAPGRGTMTFSIVQNAGLTLPVPAHTETVDTEADLPPKVTYTNKVVDRNGNMQSGEAQPPHHSFSVIFEKTDLATAEYTLTGTKSNDGEKVSIDAIEVIKEKIRDLTAISDGGDNPTVILSWTNPSDDLSLSKIEIVWNELSSSYRKKSITANGAGNGQSEEITGLRKGRKYTFSVVAVFNAGSDALGIKSAPVKVSITP